MLAHILLAVAVAVVGFLGLLHPRQLVVVVVGVARVVVLVVLLRLHLLRASPRLQAVLEAV
jgi:hypothetical protein